MKAIRLSAHASSYIASRGFTEAEVEETIRESRWEPAELGRMECRKVFSINREWNGKLYASKGLRMKIAYDPKVDALSITFRETTVTTKHLAEGIAADYDTDGKLAGIEILDVIKRFGDKETLRQVVIEGLGPSQSS
jgi:uncharacterized protein YuzE